MSCASRPDGFSRFAFNNRPGGARGCGEVLGARGPGARARSCLMPRVFFVVRARFRSIRPPLGHPRVTPVWSAAFNRVARQKGPRSRVRACLITLRPPAQPRDPFCSILQLPLRAVSSQAARQEKEKKKSFQNPPTPPVSSRIRGINVEIVARRCAVYIRDGGICFSLENMSRQL